MIGDPCCMLWSQVVDAFDGRAAKRAKAAKSTLIYRVHFTLKSNSAWWELHAKHVARFEATVTHAAQIQQYIENFEGKDFQDAVEEALFLQQVVKSMPAFLASARRSKFEEEFEKRVRNLFAAKLDFSDHCLASATFSEVYLESVVRILPSMMTFVLPDYLKKLAVWESELCKQRAMDNFDKLREVTTVESFICEAKLSELHLAPSSNAAQAAKWPSPQRTTWPGKRLRNWRYGNASATPHASLRCLGPDFPKRAAATVAEAKVEFFALAKTSTQDPSFFGAGHPDQMLQEKVRGRHQVNLQGDDEAGQQPPAGGS